MFLFPLVQFFSDPKKREPGAFGGSASSVSCHHHSAPALSGRRSAKPQPIGGSDGRSESCIWGILEAKTG